MKKKLIKSRKIIILGPSGSGKSYEGFSVIQKKKPKTVLIGSCAVPEFYKYSFPFLKDFKWKNHETYLSQPHVGEKVFVTDLTAIHVTTKKMNYFCEECANKKDATIFYADGTWGENGFAELFTMNHYKCNIIIEAQSLSNVLKIEEHDITEDMKKDISKLGWTIVEKVVAVIPLGTAKTGKTSPFYGSVYTSVHTAKSRNIGSDVRKFHENKNLEQYKKGDVYDRRKRNYKRKRN